MLQKAAQASSDPASSRMINEAVRRAETNQAGSRRRTGIRRHLDLIAVAVASIATSTAWKERRNHDEQVSVLEAELERAHAEKEREKKALGQLRASVLNDVPDILRVMDEGGRRMRQSEREGKLGGLIMESFDKFAEKAREIESSKSAKKPNVI